MCVTYRPDISSFIVNVYSYSGLVWEYRADNVRVNTRLLPPTKDLCVEAHVVEYDSNTKWLVIHDVEIDLPEVVR